MTKPIWERKPERMLSTEARSWLAELQEEWNILQDKAEKLDQIKHLLKNYPLNIAIGKVRKILEAEGE